MPKLSKNAAKIVATDLDRLAGLFEQDHVALGVPAHIAQDAAYRMDLLADQVMATAGLDRTALTGDDVLKEQGVDPDDIGKEKGGPQEQEPDESYMKGEFSQQENRELREKTQGGELSSGGASPEPQSPSPGVQASLQQAKFALNLAATVIDKAAKAAQDDEEEGEEPAEDEKEGKKKASHGYNLYE